MQSKQYAHWHQFFENTPVSPTAFYSALSEELKARKVPETQVRKIEFAEGGPISAKRMYLSVERDWLTYHICVAPFGTGFFVSSRLLVWPWKSWPILVIIAGVLFLGLIMLFALMAATIGSAGIGMLVTLCFSMPVGFLFLLSAVLWYFLCLHMTYYRQDTMLAFQEAVHRLVVAQVNVVVESSGRKPLSDAESKPILHKLLERQAA